MESETPHDIRDEPVVQGLPSRQRHPGCYDDPLPDGATVNDSLVHLERYETTTRGTPVRMPCASRYLR